jgi:ankyrin repeat protein
MEPTPQQPSATLPSRFEHADPTARLAEAALTGKRALLEQLLDPGANVNVALDPHGRTALAHAIASGMIEGACVRIKRGALDCALEAPSTRSPATASKAISPHE